MEPGLMPETAWTFKPLAAPLGLCLSPGMGAERVGRGRAKRVAAVTGAAALALGLAGVLAVGLRQPRLDRDWVEHLAVMPDIRMRPDGFALGPAYDWSYNANGPTRKATTDFEARYNDLRDVWFVLEPQPGGGYAAHTLVLFEFAGDRLIGLTVEARREDGEDYDPLLGLFNQYELAYVWSTAKELLNRRAVYLAKDVYVYPLRLSAAQERRFLTEVLRETRAVSTRPRFYNTLTSNCTNELAKTAGLDWHYSWVLTGYSPERLFALKLIPGETLGAARDRAHMSQALRRWNATPSREFDRLLLSELRRRHGDPAPPPGR